MLYVGSLRETYDKGDNDCPSKLIPGYGQDHNVYDGLELGEDPETNNINIPAIKAAMTAGGVPCEITVNNGVNKQSKDAVVPNEVNPKFKFEDQEPDSYQESGIRFRF